LQNDITTSQSDLHKTEQDCTTLNPPVIKEYLSASDEDKALFEMTFKSFKANTQLKARGRWYDWRMGVVRGLRGDMEAMVEGMREVSFVLYHEPRDCVSRARQRSNGSHESSIGQACDAWGRGKI
jgi:hypothetical protein